MKKILIFASMIVILSSITIADNNMLALPAKARFSLGEINTITLSLTTNGIYGFQTEINYNSSVLQLANIKNITYGNISDNITLTTIRFGDFISPAFNLTQKISNNTVTLLQTKIGASDNTIGQGTVAYLDFNCSSIAMTNITLSNITLVRRNGDILENVLSTWQNSQIICSKKGDTNLDGTIDYTDLLNIARKYNLCDGQSGYDWSYDVSYDGCIDFSDLLLVARNYGI